MSLCCRLVAKMRPRTATSDDPPAAPTQPGGPQRPAARRRQVRGGCGRREPGRRDRARRPAGRRQRHRRRSRHVLCHGGHTAVGGRTGRRRAPASSTTPRRGRAKPSSSRPARAGRDQRPIVHGPGGPRALTLMHIRHGKLQWAQVLAPAERWRATASRCRAPCRATSRRAPQRSAPTARRAASTARAGHGDHRGRHLGADRSGGDHRRAAPARRRRISSPATSPA